MNTLIDPERVREGGELFLAHADIDGLHGQFVALVNRLEGASAQTFAEDFARLIEHVREHFAEEERLMVAHGFPAISEHCDEHGRVLGELRQMETRVRAGRPMMARSYVRENLPGWFELHTRTMDSALAAHLAGRM
ncbi:MAG: bacteriohemerythrin [Pseudomonadota bacterium]